MAQEVIEVVERQVEVIEILERGLAGPTGPAGASPNINYEVVSSSQQVSNRQFIAADTSGGSITLTLPLNPDNGDAIDIFDYAETFDTNPLTIARNGQPIESLNEDLTANVEGAYFTLIYTGSTRGWQVVPRFGTSGGGGESTLTTQGDMLYRGVGINTRLPIGSAGQALKVNSGATAPEWGSISKSDVGLGNVDNTSDLNKVVSTATQTALNLKANLESPALTGTPTAPTASAGTNTTQVATTAFTLANRGDRYLTTSTSSHSITTGSKTFTVQSGLSYTATQDITIVYDGNPTGQHMHGVVTSYSGTTLVVNVESVEGSGGPFTAWTINVGGLLTAQGALLEANNLSDVANPATALTNIGGVPTSRSISAGTGLTGGGNLTADRTLAVGYGSSAGTACEGNDARLSDSRTPTAHKNSHAVGQSDALAPSDIGAIAQWSVFQETVSASPTTLATGRARRITISTTRSTDTEVLLPTTGNQDADLFQLIRAGNIANGRILVKTSAGGSTLADLGTRDNEGRSFTFRWQSGGSFWAIVPVDSHSADKVTSGTLDIARVPTGTTSTTVALGDHAHGNISNTGTIGSTSGLPVVTTTAGAVTTLALGTAGQVLRTKSDLSGVEFADPAAAGVTSVTGTAPIVSSGGTTPAISISAATTSADGSMSSADKTKLDAISGTNTGDQTITLTGDVTGSGTGSFVTTIAANAVTNADLAQVATATLKGRSTAGAGNVEDLSASDARTVLGLATTSAVTFASLATSPAANTAAFTTTGYSLTGSNAQSLVDLAGTWNTSGTPSAIKLNITDTASNASSNLLQLQVGGSQRFAIRKDGAAILTGGSNTTGGLETSSSYVRLGVSGGSTNWVFFGSNFYAVSSAMNIGGVGGGSINNAVFNTATLNAEASGVISQFSTTASQESRLYGTYTSSTNYQRMTIRSVKQTLSALSGASATTTGTFIPDGAVVVGVTTRVATALTGAAGYTIGDGTDADRWGDITGTAIGTTSDNRDWTAGTIECFTAGGEITLTAKTSNFTAGAIEICVFYLAGQAD